MIEADSPGQAKQDAAVREHQRWLMDHGTEPQRKAYLAGLHGGRVGYEGLQADMRDLARPGPRREAALRRHRDLALLDELLVERSPGLVRGLGDAVAGLTEGARKVARKLGFGVWLAKREGRG